MPQSSVWASGGAREEDAVGADVPELAVRGRHLLPEDRPVHLVEILPMITHAVLPAATLARPYSVSGDAILAVRRLLVCVLQLCGHVVYPSTRCLLFMCWVLGLLRYRLCDWILLFALFLQVQTEIRLGLSVWQEESAPPYTSFLKGAYFSVERCRSWSFLLWLSQEFLHSIKINNFLRHEISL